MKNKFGKSLNQYLETYAEKESREISDFAYSYRFVVVIPVCNEEPDCFNQIFSQITDDAILVILVVNSPENHMQSKDWQKQNNLLIEYLHDSSIKINRLLSNCNLIKSNFRYDILLVDRNSGHLQIPEKFGVGLARKIGCDIALKLFAEGKIEKPWIFSTDADVILPHDYFKNPVDDNDSYSALVLDFEHISDDEVLTQLQFLYDLKIRYYHAGICFVGSRYNYIPLGSTLIISMYCYPQVRGFSKRSAGEDFYLLNKLAKIKPVKYCHESSKISINSRISDRVPFGTGPALQKIADLNCTDEYCYYNPDCFVYLKKWMNYLQSLWQENNLQIDQPKDELLSELFNEFNCFNAFQKAKKQINSKEKWNQFIHEWFDAFRTLKAVHFFDKKFPRLNCQSLLKSRVFAKVINSQLKTFLENYNE